MKKHQRALAMAARPDEPAFLSEAKIQENDPAERKAERLGRKAARQLENQQAPVEFSEELDFTPEPVECTSPARLSANRANAQLSTGPKTCAGKANSSLNAVKTGLTGRTVLLPTDDASEYQRHVTAYYDELQPIGQRESDLAQSIADTAWRLKRIPGLESAIYAQGYIDFADTFKDHAPALRPGLIELHTHLAYERQLRNLQLQEARLHRRLMKDTAELRTLQQERKSKEIQALDRAAKRYVAANNESAAFDPGENGFVFSISDVQAYLNRCAPAVRARENAKQGNPATSTHTHAA